MIEFKEGISKITLVDTLPDVFKRENISPSEIWRRTVTFERGKRYLIEAASGTGKSSLCAYLYGLRRDFQGKILFDGEVDSASLSISDWQRLRRYNIGYLPQELQLFPELTAWENILLKNSLTDAISEKEIWEMLGVLGIEARANSEVGKMSIGQQQRVALIRAVCQPFDFLLLDEPVSHLDEANNRIAAELVGEAASRNNAAVVCTSVGNPLMLDYDYVLKL